MMTTACSFLSGENHSPSPIISFIKSQKGIPLLVSDKYIFKLNKTTTTQTTVAPNYYCYEKEDVIQFTLSSLPHSAWQPTLNCSLQQCNESPTDNNNCRSSSTPCYDYHTHNNISYCAPGILCSILEPCNNITYTCASNNSACIVNSCCLLQAVCVSLSWINICTSSTDSTTTASITSTTVITSRTSTIIHATTTTTAMPITTTATIPATTTTAILTTTNTT
ncbi:unnamed protein product [Rotaria magnacalcarata]|uniref:Uncharacterized protein n=1 Tax=Rotaria magnacalcarata TaxID=392030 RepID=A0A820CBP0_9BILA|nr:unnamed protein product [Rotaria magnacalcarata]CAF4211283.1 unnamed protein product [Rotaria magnacalcarata]